MCFPPGRAASVGRAGDTSQTVTPQLLSTTLLTVIVLTVIVVYVDCHVSVLFLLCAVGVCNALEVSSICSLCDSYFYI